MKLDGSLFHSRVARRIFILFIVSALIPLASLVLISYEQIKEIFIDHAEQQLRRDAKAVGMLLVDRLSYLEDQLKLLGSYSEGLQKGARQGLIDMLNSGMAADYARLTWISESGEVVALRGEVIVLAHPITAMSSGASQLLAAPSTQKDVPAVIYLVHRPTPFACGYLVGEVKSSAIWKFNLDTAALFWIQSHDGTLLVTSEPSTELPDHELRPGVRSTSGTFHWSLGGEPQIAAYWTLFLAYRYRSPNWVVALSNPLPQMEAHYSRHQWIILPIVGVSLLLVTLLSIYLIRRYLIPLERLKEGTQRLAERDFSQPVRVKSGDEFEDLADSFNAMAAQLDEQFHTLTTLAALDRATLAALDREHIARILLISLKKIVLYDLMAIGLIDPAQPTQARLLFDAPGRHDIGDQRVRLTETDVAALSARKSFFINPPASPLPGYLQPLLDYRLQSLLVLPIVLSQAVSAFICLAYKGRHYRHEEELARLRDLAGRISVAFANAAWREQLHHQAHHDPLTDLPNRLLLRDRLGQAISRSERSGSRIALLFIDLDRFKDVNNTLGHAVGDQLLICVAQALKVVTRSTDTLVRLGGDEFTVLIPDIPPGEDAAGVAEKVARHTLAALATPISLVGQELHMGASIGIALYPEDGHIMDELLKNADMAMYHAKNNGRGHYEFYATKLREAAIEHLRMEKALRQALERDEFRLYFQPKISARDGRLAGAEVLLRWVHPDEGFISPGAFLPFAEESGLILPISDWILEAFGRQVRSWQQQGLAIPALAINVSAHQFSRSDLIASTRHLLETFALEPDLIEFEITESVAMEDIELTATTLKRLKELGVRVSLDDFGTGHSSLSYLKQLPVDILKIDRSFVCGLPTDPESASLARAIIALAHSLGLEVVAEGVETEQQRCWLQEQGCEYLQGFLFSPAIAADDFAARYLRPGAGRSSPACTAPAVGTG